MIRYYFDHVYIQFPLWLTKALYCIAVMLFDLICKIKQLNKTLFHEHDLKINKVQSL